MKLLTLTNRFYFLSIAIIVLIGGLVSNQILRNSINKQFNKILLAEKDQLIIELHSYEDLKESYYLNVGDIITLKNIKLSDNYPLSWTDTLLYDNYQKKDLKFRQIRFSEQVDDNNYLITISKSLITVDELITNIDEVMLVMMLVIIVSLILISNRINTQVWKSFYGSLEFLSSYDIKKPQKPNFSKTKIEEFKQLNNVIGLMIEKSIQDYEALKEFSENASHEIQTPLAIIKAKAELLIQDETLSEELMNGIKVILNAANRLSHLNQDLSYFTKIDNNEFQEIAPIPLKEYINNKLNQFEDLIRLKGIRLIKEYSAEPELLINESLCYIMISNLINNSIRHNVKNGSIKIVLTNSSLEIENTGRPLNQDPELLFGRFKKNSDLKDSSGLGLALVKKICDSYNYRIKYLYNDGIHRIIIFFK